MSAPYLNYDTWQWEYPPICAEGIQQDLDCRKKLHDQETTAYRRVNGSDFVQRQGERLCPDCSNGIVADAYGSGRWSFCSTCHGQGEI